MTRYLEIDGKTIDVDRFLLDCDKIDYEESLYRFVKAAWPFVDAAPWQDGWPIEAVCEHLEAVVRGDIRRLIINIPPRTGKSSVLAICFPAWVWALRNSSHTSGPGCQFLFASYAEKLSIRDSLRCRRLIMSPWYQRLWGDRFTLNADQSNAHRFSNDKQGERLISAITSTATGEGANVFCIDDPNATNQSESEATLTETKEWWDGTASTRLNNPRLGAFIIQQQRTGEEDLSGHVLEKSIGDWTHLMLPMHYEPARSFPTSIGWMDPRTTEGELLWPERFGPTEVDILERTLGPYKAAGQLEQRPEPAGGGVIKREWWKLWEEDTFPPFDYILASLDTAYTLKTENDYSALTVWGVYTAGTTATGPTRVVGLDGRPVDFDRQYAQTTPRVMLMTAWMERLEVHQLVKKVAKTCVDLKVDKVLIEAKAAGHSVAQEIRRLYGHENFAVQLFDPRSQDKLARLYSIQHLFAEGLIYAPDKSWADMVITQVGVFPKGRNDDLVDTCSQALRHIRDLGLLQRAPERLYEIEDAQRFEGRVATPLYPGT